MFCAGVVGVGDAVDSLVARAAPSLGVDLEVVVDGFVEGGWPRAVVVDEIEPGARHIGAHGHEFVEVALVHLDRLPHAAKVRRARGPPPGIHDPGQRRQQNRQQESDDRDHHEEFD